MLTYTWENIIAVAVLDILGIAINVWFLYMIKSRESPYNAIDVLQAFKTMFCLIALVACVWIEAFDCPTIVCVAVKELLDDVFIFSTCFTFLAIAYIRRKVCMCRGRASVLVTQRYAVKTMFICFMPVGMFVAANLTHMINGRTFSSNEQFMNASKTGNTEFLDEPSQIAYELCHVVILVVLPITISAVLYVKIYIIVAHTARTVDRSVTQRTRDPSKMIITSLIILLVMMLSVWGVFVIVKTISLFLKMDEIFFLYWKIVILISSPIGDGLLQQSKRKKVENTNNMMLSRSARRVYPLSPSPTISQVDETYEGLSLAEKLPALIEEAETSLRTSTEDENVNRRVDPKSNVPIKKRRQSVKHPRASVLIRNAAVIGLEFQENASFVDFGRRRKVSQEQLRSDLKDIESIAINRERSRRLSNCLRLSAVEVPSEDEIYHLYKEIYSRRGSRYSDKSGRGSSQGAIPAFKELSYASLNSDKDRKISDVSSVTHSPSQKRWRKLFTTAKSARRFSEMRKYNTGMDIEEEPAKQHSNRRAHGSKYDQTERAQQKLSVFSMAQQTKYNNNALERRSLDSHLNKEEKAHDKKGKTTTKKRSLSCVSNEWMNDKDNRKVKVKKKSVTFIADTKPNHETESAEHMQRSISYDSKMYLNYTREGDKKDNKHGTRYSHGDVQTQRRSEDTTNVQHWLSDSATTRQECIDKLMEMKDYF